MSTSRLSLTPRLPGPATPRITAIALALAVAQVHSAHADVSIVLHAIDHPDRVHCYVPEEMGYRDPATQTRTSVAANSEIDVFVYLVGYEQTNGAGFRLAWPADWEYFGWVSDCLPPGQITIADLQDDAIDIATAFNQRTGDAPLPLGYASFRTSGTGEVRLEATRYCIDDGGACYLSNFEEYAIPLPRLGRVAVGGPGYNPAAMTPVAAATWGAIKASYRN
jgi:hypothetical protein